MHWKDYEKLIQQLLAELASPLLSGWKVQDGTVLIKGASTFDHQVDVSLHNETSMVLIDAKCLGSPVGVNDVLVLSGRKLDVQAAHPQLKVSARLVSLMHPAAGAVSLANFFDVGIDVAESVHEYATWLGSHLSIVLPENREPSNATVTPLS